MRKTLISSHGHVLTNGEIYGTTIYLAEGADASTFYEITAQEYEAIMAEPQDPSEDDAVKALFDRFGVEYEKVSK